MVCAAASARGLRWGLAARACLLFLTLAARPIAFFPEAESAAGLVARRGVFCAGIVEGDALLQLLLRLAIAPESESDARLIAEACLLDSWHAGIQPSALTSPWMWVRIRALMMVMHGMPAPVLWMWAEDCVWWCVERMAS